MGRRRPGRVLWAAGAVFVAVVPALASFLGVRSLSRRLERFDDRLASLDASFARASKEAARAAADGTAALGAVITQEGKSIRAEARLQSERSGVRLFQSAQRRDELVSDLSLKLDRLVCSLSPPAVERDAGEGRGETLPVKDIFLAHALEEAERLYAAGRYADAASRYSVVAEAAPGNPVVRRKLALSLYKANPADGSEYPFVERELKGEAEAGGAEALEILASISIERQDWEQALAYYDLLFASQPEDAKALREAGDCALYAGKLDAAASYFDRAFAADPRDLESARRRDFARASVKGSAR